MFLGNFWEEVKAETLPNLPEAVEGQLLGAQQLLKAYVFQSRRQAGGAKS